MNQKYQPVFKLENKQQFLHCIRILQYTFLMFLE